MTWVAWKFGEQKIQQDCVNDRIMYEGKFGLKSRSFFFSIYRGKIEKGQLNTI